MLERLVAATAATSPAPPATPATPAPKSAPASPDLDDEAVRTMIAAVRELAAVTDHTFVLRDLLNPATLAPLPPATLEAWHGVAERIAREGHAPLLDFNDGTFAPSDFGDRTHLNPLAAERFSSLLAARVREAVHGGDAPR
jgi:hypothetical protein